VNPSSQRSSRSGATSTHRPPPAAGLPVMTAMLDLVTSYADELMARLERGYSARADPERAVTMRAYMRDQFPFVGLAAPDRRRLDREVLAGTGRPAEADLVEVAHRCWALAEREYQYFAVDLLRRWVRVAGPGFLDTTATLITTKPWWDTVDELAAHVVGPLVLRFPELAATMDAWVDGPDMWLTRTAILHQNGYKAATDARRLFAHCAARAEHRDFFIRKAIGWALREYARTDPQAVRTFIEQHRDTLSGLSIREALKHLGTG
jgi:3-methyladenine DNA glycosylase AlkD